MSYLGDYFRRQTGLDPSHLNRWERRTFGGPQPVWLRDAFFVGSGAYFVFLTVETWDYAPVLSLFPGFFALGFVVIFVEWLFKWLGRLFDGVGRLFDVFSRPADNPCHGKGPHYWGHVWRRKDPNFFTCVKCGERYRAR